MWTALITYDDKEGVGKIEARNVVTLALKVFHYLCEAPDTDKLLNIVIVKDGENETVE